MSHPFLITVAPESGDLHLEGDPESNPIARAFLAECSSVERCQPILADLRQAVAELRTFVYCRNAIELAYCPSSGLVSFTFLYPGVFEPGVEHLDSASVLDLLAAWLGRLQSPPTMRDVS